MAENAPANDEIARKDAPESADPSVSSKQLVALARKEARRVERAERRKTPSSASKRRPSGVRAIGTAAAVCALIAGIAIPAFAANQNSAQAATEASARNEAAADAQSFAAGEDAKSADIVATNYSARSADEISQLEAEREALKRAKAEAKAAAEARAAAAQQVQAAPAAAPEQAPAAPAAPAPAATGSWGMPLPAGSYSFGDGVGYMPGHYASQHQGQDMLSAAGTPIYAVQNCVVTYAGFSGGFGNLVVLDCNVDGNQVTVKNGHMSSIAVSTGQQVSMGQQIGNVGSTGFSTANHLHIETWINGVLANPRDVLPIG